jgi:predicted dehydrogenase
MVDTHYIHRMDWYYRKSSWTVTDTDWVFLGLSHPIDLVRWYLGRIEEVHCYGGTSAMGREHGLKGRDIHTVNLRAADGRIGRVMGHYGLHELPTARNCIECVIYASGGTSMAQYHDMKLIWTGKEGDPMTEFVEDHLYAGRHYYFNSEVHGMHFGEFANYAQHFAEAILDGKPHSPGLEEGVETFCVMEAVRRSAREGRAVEVGGLLGEVGVSQLPIRDLGWR